MLLDERFFDLPAEVGGLVPDGAWRAMTVTIGQATKRVVVYDPPVDSDAARRALRVWACVRAWIDAPEAFEPK